MSSVIKVWDNTNKQWINIPALAGDPGVYIGTTAPTNPAKKVWIDPSGTANTIGTEDVKYKIYNSVEDIGLTVGSATIAGAVAALPAYSILIAQSEDWLASELPGSYGLVEICRQGTSTRVSIEFRGRREIDGMYIMYMTGGAGSVPTGTWMPVYTGVVQSSTCTAASNTTVSDNYVKKVGNLVCLFLDLTKIAGSSAIATIPEGYRPATNLFLRVGTFPSGSSTADAIPVWISTNGSITTRANFAGEVVVNATYFTN